MYFFGALPLIASDAYTAELYEGINRHDLATTRPDNIVSCFSQGLSEDPKFNSGNIQIFCSGIFANPHCPGNKGKKQNIVAADLGTADPISDLAIILNAGILSIR